MNRLLFGPYPLFRIPVRPKAAFLDIDKTLIKEGERQEKFLALDPKWVWALKQERERYRFRILTYGDPHHGVIYKITLFRPKRMEWSREETKRLMRAEEMEGMEGIRWFAEGSCLEIVHKEATKAGGVRFICQSLGILPRDAAAMGDGPEDEEMMELCASSLRGRIRRSIQ